MPKDSPIETMQHEEPHHKIFFNLSQPILPAETHSTKSEGKHDMNSELDLFADAADEK